MTKKIFIILHLKLCLSRICSIEYADMIHLSEQVELSALEI